MRHPAMQDFHVVVRIPVQWGDMDAYDHVNNTVFFRFFETARIAYLERIHFVESRDLEGVGAILHSTQCRFRNALRYPDEVLVGARTTTMNEDRFTHEYRIFSTAQNAVVAEGWGIVVSFDYTSGHKTALPDPVRNAIETIDDVSMTRL